MKRFFQADATARDVLFEVHAATRVRCDIFASWSARRRGLPGPVVNVFIVSLPIPRLRDAGCCGPRSGAARRLEQSFTGVRLKGGVDLGDREVDTIRWDELPHD